MQHIPGTIYPTNGARPHLPTMCSHRTMLREGGHSRTLLCYEMGKFTLALSDGSDAACATIQTAEGPMPNLRCAKHVKGWAESYAPDAQGRQVCAVPARP